MKASFGGHDKVVELLLAAGAKLDVCALVRHSVRVVLQCYYFLQDYSGQIGTSNF